MLPSHLLSIVVAVYNGEKFLEQFFKCILNQSLNDVELIVVNDGSTDASEEIIHSFQDSFDNMRVITIPNQGVSVARNHGLALARGKYLAFPDIDDLIYPEMYSTLLDMAERNQLDVATCNGRYVYEGQKTSRTILPQKTLKSTGVIPGFVWLKQALNSRKFLHVTWLNIYRHSFIKQHQLSFEPNLGHQDIPWTTEILLAAERVQYTDQIFYDYLIHSNSVSHKQDGDEGQIRSAHNYMKILRMLDNINQRYPDKVRQIPACHWQIAKEGLGIIHSIDNIKDHNKKKQLATEFLQNGSWGLVWKNTRGFRLYWRLGRRFIKLKKLVAHSL